MIMGLRRPPRVPARLRWMSSPEGSFNFRMNWHDLLFAHWPIAIDVLRPLIPSALEVDTFESTAWIGIVPFRMTEVGPRLLPPIPGLSEFPELNVRTYVRHRENAGVWFFSLDAANRVAVRVARWKFHLPYFDAKMSCLESEGWIRYRNLRTHRESAPAEFVGRYRPRGDVYASRPGSLDHWLTERYFLYSQDRKGKVYRGDITHVPWPLQRAEAEIEVNRMTALLGVDLPGDPAHLHFARRVDVLARDLEPVA